LTTLEVTTSDRADGGIQVELTGELDLATAAKLDDELQKVEARRPALIVLDLQPLTFMDSSGLRVLLAADARARENGIRFVLVRGDERVQRVLRITRLDERLEIVEDAEMAGAPEADSA
jgi:anti-sigma B factor antagonist